MAARTTRSERYRAALEMARTTPLEHVPRLVQAQAVRAELSGVGLTGRFNEWLAVIITKSVGSMWAAYLFALLALVSLPQALVAFTRGDALTGIDWLSQSFLQLVLLPVILVGQNVISAAQDARAEADHETITALHAIHVHQLKILEHQEKLLERLDHRVAGPSGER